MASDDYSLTLIEFTYYAKLFLARNKFIPMSCLAYVGVYYSYMETVKGEAHSATRGFCSNSEI